ncbi:MAG: hypothetical protein QXO12_01290 [Candidatus Pacearchaeota archaeon]
MKNKKNFFNFLLIPFKFFFKNIYVALPSLFFLISSSIISLIFSFLFLASGFSLINQDLNLENFKFSSFFSLLLLIFLYFLFLIILSSLFFSSTLVFSRNIVNGLREKNYLKNLFAYTKYWWKILVLSLIFIFLIFIISIPFGLIIIFLAIKFFSTFNTINLIFLILILIFSFIILVIFSLFFYPSIYCLVYYDSGLFESIKISFINVYKNFLEFFNLNLILFLIYSLLSIFSVFSNIILSSIVSVVLILFFIPFSSLTIMYFIKNKFKRKIKK